MVAWSGHRDCREQRECPRVVEAQYGTVLVGADGIVHHWDEGARALLGHDGGDAIGQTLDLIVPPAFREAHWAGFRAAMATGTLRTENDVTTLPVLCADGLVRPYVVRFHLLRDAVGVPVGVVGIFTAPRA